MAFFRLRATKHSLLMTRVELPIAENSQHQSSVCQTAALNTLLTYTNDVICPATSFVPKHLDTDWIKIALHIVNAPKQQRQQFSSQYMC